MNRGKLYRCKLCGLTGKNKRQIFEHSCTEKLLQVSESRGASWRDYDAAKDWEA